MSDFCSAQIVALASGVWQELNSPTAISVGYISGIFSSSGFLGELNNRLTTSFYFSGDGPCIVGGFGGKEAAIYALMYEAMFLKRMGLSAMQAGGTFWVSIAENDSRVARESPTKVAAEYREMKKEVDEDLRIATAQWKIAHTLAVGVNFASLSSWPTP